MNETTVNTTDLEKVSDPGFVWPMRITAMSVEEFLALDADMQRYAIYEQSVRTNQIMDGVVEAVEIIKAEVMPLIEKVKTQGLAGVLMSLGGGLPSFGSFRKDVR